MGERVGRWVHDDYDDDAGTGRLDAFVYIYTLSIFAAGSHLNTCIKMCLYAACVCIFVCVFDS